MSDSSSNSDSADRLLAHRLSALSSNHAPITVTMPPPSVENLAARLKRLSPNQKLKGSDEEEELRRRFDKLNANYNTTHHSSSSSIGAPLYSNSAILLAGQRTNEANEIDRLMQLAQEEARLERQKLSQFNNELYHPSTASLIPPETSGVAASLHSNPSSSLSSSSASSSSRPLTDPISTDPFAHPSPQPSKAEIDALMKQLEQLPDSDIIAQMHRASEACEEVKRTSQRSNQYDDTHLDHSDDDSDGDGDDAAVDEIINQARDEARMGL